MAVLLDVALLLCGGTGVWLRLVGAQGLPLLGQPVPVPKVILHICLWGHHSLALGHTARPATPAIVFPPRFRPGPFPDQNHVSRGDVHVGLGRFLAPGWRAAVGTGAGLGRVAELRGHTAHPRRLWLTLCPVKQGLCGHVLATQVLQRKDWVRLRLLRIPLQRVLSHKLNLVILQGLRMPSVQSSVPSAPNKQGNASGPTLEP